MFPQADAWKWFLHLPAEAPGLEVKIWYPHKTSQTHLESLQQAWEVQLHPERSNHVEPVQAWEANLREVQRFQRLDLC